MNNRRRKTILVTLSNRAVYRNLFFFPGCVFDQIKELAGQREDCRIVVIVPKKDNWKYVGKLGEGENKLYSFEFVEAPNSKENFIQKLFYAFYSHLIYTDTTRLMATLGMRPDEPPAGGKRYLSPLKWFIANSFGKIDFIKLKIIPRIFYFVYRTRPFEEIFNVYKPDLVFISHLYGWFDQNLLAESKRKKVL